MLDGINPAAAVEAGFENFVPNPAEDHA